MTAALPPGVAVFERGWLSSNNILLDGADGQGATLIEAPSNSGSPSMPIKLTSALVAVLPMLADLWHSLQTSED